MPQKQTLPLTEIDGILPILEKISILGGLSDSQLYKVYRELEVVSYSAVEFSFSAGDQPSHIYIVWDGEVEIFLPSGEFYLAQAVLGVGQLFGETAVIGIQAHSASVLAKQDTKLMALSRKSLFSFF